MLVQAEELDPSALPSLELELELGLELALGLPLTQTNGLNGPGSQT